MSRPAHQQLTGYLTIALLVLIGVITFSISFGSVRIPLSEIAKSLISTSTPHAEILWNVRYPRVAISLITGINLALSGLLLQAILKNPLSDPGILGINSGATLGATFVMLLFPQSSGIVPLVAFISGLLIFMIVLVISWKGNASPTRLILSGVAVNAIVSGCQSVLTTTYSERLSGVVTWINGSLSGKTWSQVGLMLGYSLPLYVIIFLLHQRLDLLSLDNQAIFSLGISIKKYRLIVACLAVSLAAITVSQVGLIGFVGLIVPHIARILAKGRFIVTIPFTMLIGCIVVALADTVARLAISPLELPIGTVMSIIGGPFFLYLLATQHQLGGRK